MKKQMKNSARLPRTAGLRTLSELTDSLTQAGLDPSRIQERAEVIAKTRAAQRKRKREDEDAEMDVDAESNSEMSDGGGESMDIDNDGGSSAKKRRKSNSGAVTAVAAKGKREPRANRQLAGLRDNAVRRPGLFTKQGLTHFATCSKRPKRPNYVTSANANGICLRRQGKVTAPSGLKWYVTVYSHSAPHTYKCRLVKPKHLFSGKRKMGKTNRR